MTALFQASDVHRAFRSASGAEIRALEAVTLEIPRGAFFAITGPTGCGKTTLLSLLGALDRPTSGTIRFDGQDLDALSETGRSRVRRRLGLVFQHSPMIRTLPLWENVTYPLVPLGMSARERRHTADRLLERVGMDDRATARPEELSGGELQRVGVARALVADPDALLIDEPTSHLDADSAAQLVALFREIHAAGTTLVVATHNPTLQGSAAEVYELPG